MLVEKTGSCRRDRVRQAVSTPAPMWRRMAFRHVRTARHSVGIDVSVTRTSAVMIRIDSRIDTAQQGSSPAPGTAYRLSTSIVTGLCLNIEWTQHSVHLTGTSRAFRVCCWASYGQVPCNAAKARHPDMLESSLEKRPLLGVQCIFWSTQLFHC